MLALEYISLTPNVGTQILEACVTLVLFLVY